MHDGDAPTRERRALVTSMVGAIAFAALGIVLGVVSGSAVILFDGFYSLIGVALSGMAVLASRAARSEPTAAYPFGRAGVAPLVVLVEGVALIAMCAYAGLEALSTLLAGGGDVLGGWAIVYAVVSVIVPLVLVWVLGRAGHSDLVAAEATQWRIGAGFGVGMLVAFVVALGLDRAGHADLASLVDPGLVLVASVLFLVAPVRLVRSTLVELLEGAPADEVAAPVQAAIDRVTRRHALADPVVRMNKIGPKLYVDLGYLVPASWTVAAADDVRHDLADELASLPHEPWCTVEFSADPAWLR